MALKRTRGFMKTLEGSCFRRFTSNAKQKTYRILHFHENPVPRVKDDTRKKLLFEVQPMIRW